MNLTIRRSDLVDALNLLKEMCPVRFLEADRGLLISAVGDLVVLEATDDANWGRVAIGRVAISAEGKVGTDPRILGDLVGRMDSDEIEVLATERVLTILSPGSRYTLRAFDPSLHPAFPRFPGNWAFSAEYREFRRLVDRVVFIATSQKSADPNALPAIAVGTEDGALVLRASDGIRHARGVMSVSVLQAIDGSEVLLHPSTLRKVAGLGQLAGGDVLFQVQDNSAYICSGDAYFKSPLYTGKTLSPLIDKMLTKVPISTVVVDSSALTAPLDRLTLLAEISAYCPVKLLITQTGCIMTTEIPDAGNAEERVPISDVKGPGFQVVVNGKLLGDIINRLKAPQVEIGYYGTSRVPIRVVPTDQRTLMCWVNAVLA